MNHKLKVSSKEGMTLLDVQRGVMLRANRTGAFIISRDEAGRGNREIAMDLSEEFGVPFEQALQATDAYLAVLDGHGLRGRA